jgi:hypothetical protein
MGYELEIEEVVCPQSGIIVEKVLKRPAKDDRAQGAIPQVMNSCTSCQREFFRPWHMPIASTRRRRLFPFDEMLDRDLALDVTGNRKLPRKCQSG